jgi:serine/threonine kinase 32
MGNFNSKTHPQPYDLPKGTIRITEKYHLTHFTLISQLGKGTFCKVMAVENLGSGRMQAMKYCFKERLLEKKAINHIIQERTLLENLNHPYICNLLYSFQDTNYVYMVLDLMTGGDLRAHVFQPIPEVWTTIFIYQEGCRIIMAEVCLALEYLHKNNIVHRDIKPDVR